jgi:hypothetical protein
MRAVTATCPIPMAMTLTTQPISLCRCTGVRTYTTINRLIIRSRFIIRALSIAQHRFIARAGYIVPPAYIVLRGFALRVCSGPRGFSSQPGLSGQRGLSGRQEGCGGYSGAGNIGQSLRASCEKSEPVFRPMHGPAHLQPTAGQLVPAGAAVRPGDQAPLAG